MLAAALLAALLGIVALPLFKHRGIAARFAALAESVSRPRRISAYAAGTALNHALPAVLVLLLLGRLDGIVTMPTELREAAYQLGLPAYADAALLHYFTTCLASGVAFGILLLLLLLLRKLGRRPFGLRYRSPLAVRSRAEWLPATALSISAGVSEEMFFRLALPLLVAILTGSGLAGLAFALLLFVALHRHQGPVGMVAVALVGAWLTWIYLWTGLLWVAIALHVLIDLNALVIRPAISSSAATPSGKSRRSLPGTGPGTPPSPPG